MKAIVTFMGFTETTESSSGTERLYLETIRPFASRSVLTYEPRTWKTDVVTLAAQLRRFRVEDVAIVSYSHGQAAACALAGLARDYGFDVPLWLACDPVFRPWWVPRSTLGQLLAVRALIPGSAQITVPKTVGRVAWVRQTTDIPRGHDLIAEDRRKTLIQTPLVIPCGHTQIDEADEWRDLVATNLNEFCK